MEDSRDHSKGNSQSSMEDIPDHNTAAEADYQLEDNHCHMVPDTSLHIEDSSSRLVGRESWMEMDCRERTGAEVGPQDRASYTQVEIVDDKCHGECWD